MPRFLVERPLPGIGTASREEQQAMVRVSNEIIEKLGSENIRWVESLFTADKAYCLYDARDAEIVREFSRMGGLPYDKITEVRYTLEPASTE